MPKFRNLLYVQKSKIQLVWLGKQALLCPYGPDNHRWEKGRERNETNHGGPCRTRRNNKYFMTSHIYASFI